MHSLIFIFVGRILSKNENFSFSAHFSCAKFYPRLSCFHSVPFIRYRSYRKGPVIGRVSRSCFQFWNLKKSSKWGPNGIIWISYINITWWKLKREKNLQWICGDSDVSDLKLATFFECWWQNFDLGDIFLMLVSDTSIKK